MHNLHYFVLRASSAVAAAEEIDAKLDSWGDDNNYYHIGGVACEDGTDNIDNWGKGDDDNWVSLSQMDEDDDFPKTGTYYERALADVREEIDTPEDLNEEIQGVIKWLGDININGTQPPLPGVLLWQGSEFLLTTKDKLHARQSDRLGPPSYRPWKVDDFGMTPIIKGHLDDTGLHEENTDQRRYVVFVDMHS